jgi:CelD/BcsL family acetyltransferase involved in cellulose biosynthesis
MKTHVARTAAEMERLSPAWERLYAADPQATMFQSFAWNRLAAECFGAREEPHVVLVEDDSGAALIPAAVTHDRVVLLGDAMFDYRDVLCTGDEDALRQAWAVLAELRLGLEVTAVRGDARRHWEGLHPEPFVSAPQVRVRDIGADAFMREHSLARALRRLERAGVQLRHQCGSATTLVREIYRAKAAQPVEAGSNVFRDAARVDFMIAACAMNAGACDIYTLTADADLVAALVTFRDRGARRFYTVYFDVAWARYSPGVALLYEVTRRSLAEGLDCDYMTGEQAHKMRFATSATPLYKVHATAEALAKFAGAVEPQQLAA